jgi:hypothetical protein
LQSLVPWSPSTRPRRLASSRGLLRASLSDWGIIGGRLGHGDPQPFDVESVSQFLEPWPRNSCLQSSVVDATRVTCEMDDVQTVQVQSDSLGMVRESSTHRTGFKPQNREEETDDATGPFLWFVDSRSQ